MLINGVTAMVGRRKFRYRDSAELTMTETPVGETTDYLSDAELIARLSVLHAKTVRYIVGGFVSLPLAAIFIIAGGNERFTVPTGIACVLLLVFGVCVCRGSVASDTSKKMFKLNVVQGALAELVEGCVYNAKMSISRERIETTGLIHGWNTFAGNDYLRGLYQGHEIELSDIHLTEVHEERNGEDSNTVTTTIFSGQWLTCRLDKKLPASVILRESGGKGNAETENIAFNRKYQIETEDPHYMFYVLTPHFMEYIVTADEKADARTFFCFAGDRVHIALHNKHDAFEIPTYEFTENFVTTAREKIKEEMKYITDILDEVLRNEYLF
jgi:hypothetical protein